MGLSLLVPDSSCPACGEGTLGEMAGREMTAEGLRPGGEAQVSGVWGERGLRIVAPLPAHSHPAGLGPPSLGSPQLLWGIWGAGGEGALGLSIAGKCYCYCYSSPHHTPAALSPPLPLKGTPWVVDPPQPPALSQLGSLLNERIANMLFCYSQLSPPSHLGKIHSIGTCL